MPKIIVGISGASGAIYGLRLLERLKKAGYKIVDLTVSPFRFEVFERRLALKHDDVHRHRCLQVATAKHLAKRLAKLLETGGNLTDLLVGRIADQEEVF